MSLQQYNSLMSSLLKEKHALTKLREELEGREGKLYRSYKGFGHLAQNYRNKRGEKKGTVISQNKFEILKSRVMQCGVSKKSIRRVEVVEVECYKYGGMGHKCRECPLWKKAKEEKRRVEEKVVCVAKLQKMQQERRLACPIREKAQEKKKRLRRVEEEEAVHVAKPREVQQE